MTGEWSDEFNPEGVAVRTDCGRPTGNHDGVKDWKMPLSPALVRNRRRRCTRSAGRSGERAEHAAQLVARDELVRPTGFVAVLRVSALGTLFLLSALAAGLGLRSISELCALR